MEMLALERSLNRFPGYLLPPRACLFIAHDEVLIVNSGQMKVEHPPIYCRFPHQTGVTERSIGSHKRSPADSILSEMMIRHQTHRISDGFAIIGHRQNHIGIVYK